MSSKVEPQLKSAVVNKEIHLPEGKIAPPGLESCARWLGPGVVVLYFLLNALVISPIGNFPLNDDWIYSESVSHLLKTGQFHLLGCSPVCFLHVLLGALASASLGFSHTVLRSITVIEGLVTCLVLYATLRRFEIKRADSALLTMVLAANPLFVNVSFSFMTDVPAMMFAALYALFAVRAIQKQSPGNAIIAGVLLCCSILVRQTFVALAPGSLLLVLLGKGNSRKMNLSLLLTCVIAPVVVAMLAERFMIRGNEFTGVYAWYKSQFAGVFRDLVTSPLPTAGALFERLFKICSYLSLFCLPLLPGAIKLMAIDIKNGRRLSIAALVASALVTVPCFIHTFFISSQLMPYNQNLLRIPMVGPINLMGICVALIKPRHRLWLTIACAVLALLLISVIFAALLRCADNARRLLADWRAGRQVQEPERCRRLTVIFAGSMLALTLAFLCVQTTVFDFDRYYLMALPALLICLGLYSQENGLKLVSPLSIVLLISLAAYSTLATQDYLAWNRARWQAISDLERAGVSPLKIDGGPEYNYLANPDLIRQCEFSAAGFNITHRGVPPRCNWRWWSISGEDYIVSFSPVPEYELVATHSYFGGLTLSRREVLTLKHIEEQPPSGR